MFRLLTLLAAAMLVAGPAIAENADDRHEGYYYPPPGEIETYTARVEALPDSDRQRRIGFVVGLTRELLNQRYAAYYAVFAKGDDAEKLIIVGLVDGQLNTIYRARALFATLTSVARVTPFFQENALVDNATFFDLLKLLGFEQVTISDGVAFSHQVMLQ